MACRSLIERHHLETLSAGMMPVEVVAMYQAEASLEATVVDMLEDMVDMEELEKILQDLEGMVDIPKRGAVVATTVDFRIMVVDLDTSMVSMVSMVSAPCSRSHRDQLSPSCKGG